MSRYTRQQLVDNLALPFQYPEGELELYPRMDEYGWTSLDGDYRGIILDKLVAPKAIFHSANLPGAHFIEASLEGADFAQADLSGTHFDRANLSETNWALTDMSGAFFVEADFTKASMHGVKAHGTHFTDANLTGVHIGWSDEFYRCSFWNASLVGVEAECVDFYTCTFTGANLRGATFKDCEFKLCDFTGADLTGATFEGCIMNVVYFRDTKWERKQALDTQYWEMYDGEPGYQALRDGYDQRRKGYEY